MFAQRTLGSPGGKHHKSLEGNVWRKAVSMSKKKILGKDQRFFAIVLSQKNLDSVGYVENESFCLNNPEMRDKTYR